MHMELVRYISARLNLKSERGAALVEYALLLALIAVVCIVALTTLGKQASSKFTNVVSMPAMPVPLMGSVREFFVRKTVRSISWT